jgi:hypothetical protein
MGEYEAVIDRLNKILTENGFPKVSKSVLTPYDDGWYAAPVVPIRFDKNGKYVTAIS